MRLEVSKTDVAFKSSSGPLPQGAGGRPSCSEQARPAGFVGCEFCGDKKKKIPVDFLPPCNSLSLQSEQVWAALLGQVGQAQPEGADRGRACPCRPLLLLKAMS